MKPAALLLLAIATLSATRLTRPAQASPTKLRTELVPTAARDARIPSALPRKLDEFLIDAVERARVRPRQIARTSTVSAAGDAAQVERTLLAGKMSLAQFRFADAVREFSQASDQLEAEWSQGRMSLEKNDLLTQALTGLAISQQELARTADVLKTCHKLMSIRPRTQLDRVQVHPDVVRACDEASRALATRGERELLLRSSPALAKIVVDGLPVGTTPMTLRLRAGRHLVGLLREGSVSAMEIVDIDGTGPRLERLITLQVDPVNARERIASELSKGASIESTLQQCRQLLDIEHAEELLLPIVKVNATGDWSLELVAVARAGIRARSSTLLLESMEGIERRLDELLAALESPEAAAVIPSGVAASLAPGPPKASPNWRLILGVTLGSVAVVTGVTLGLVFGLSDTRDRWRIHGQ